MEMIVYGEDALTLWALKNRMKEILDKDDSTPPSGCVAFYRPSFGRKGGDNSCQFGEFDFIVLSRDRLYLGETKWERSRITGRGQVPDKKQVLRHAVLAEYVGAWFQHDQWDQNFEDRVRRAISPKPIAGPGTITRRSLETLLRVIRQHYCSKPKIVNVLLYVYEAGNVEAAEAVKNMHVAREFVLRPVVFLRDPELGDSIRLTVDG